MEICHANDARAVTPDPKITAALNSVSEKELREIVEAIAIPRHYEKEAESNRRIAAWISAQLQSFGYPTTLEGDYSNVMALPAKTRKTPLVLVGAHYDNVSGTPGADDNASAVAA